MVNYLLNKVLVSHFELTSKCVINFQNLTTSVVDYYGCKINPPIPFTQLKSGKLDRFKL